MQQDAFDRIARQSWLDTAAEEVQPVVGEVFKSAGPAGQKVKDFLNGVWLGHALHPVMTDVPLGAWTATVAMDVAEIATGSTECAPGADAALAVGLAGAVGAAVTGLADWADIDGEERRVGFLHGLLNAAGTALMATSLVLRRANKRPAAQALSFAGYGTAIVAAWLGGHLVYDRQVGVDRAYTLNLPEEWTDVMAEDDLPDRTLQRVDVDAVRMLVARRGAHVFAMLETCSHLGGPLSQGKLEGNEVVCPWHGSRFALDDGEVICGPASHRQPILQTRVVNGRIEVRAPR